MVVQHTPVGGLLGWSSAVPTTNPAFRNTTMPAPWAPSSSTTAGSNAVHTFTASGTTAPWPNALADSRRAPALPSSSVTQPTSAPWSTGYTGHLGLDEC